MTQISARAEREVDAPANLVYRILSDYRQHHPRILPPAFSPLTIEAGGIGSGTIISFSVTVGGRTVHHRVQVEEVEPGRLLVESNPETGLRTTFTVTPRGAGRSHVAIETRYAKGGIMGAIEGLVAPRAMRSLFGDELQRLEAYAHTLAT
jgi:uncharacterized protein YndB with AHSA1/START domain